MKAPPGACLAAIALLLVGCSAGPPANTGPGTMPAAAGATAAARGAPRAEDRDEPVDAVIGRLRGLPFQAFVSDSYHALLARSPERVTELGIAEQLGMRNDRLDDLSPTHRDETQRLERAVRDLLGDFDRAALPPDQRLSYDVYAWHLDDLVRGQPFADHDYAVFHCRGGYHYELLRLLTDLQPMGSRDDAEDYLSRLGRVDDQVAQMLEGLRRREAAGILLPRFIAARTRDLLTSYLGTTSRDTAAVDPASLSVYTSFSEKLEGIAGLGDAERAAYRRRALAELRASFVPAYLAQLDYLDHLVDVGTDDAGVWKLPKGDDYYAHLVRSQTTTDLSPAEVHAQGLRQVARIRAELRQALAAMGYPEDRDLGELLSRAVEDAGSLPMQTQAERDEVLRAWEALVDDADERVAPAFGLRPAAGLAVVGESGEGAEGAYYDPAPAGGSQACEFHVGQSAASQPTYIMPTVAFHEGIPGHHYQVGLARELDLPPLRKDLRFIAFSEGWAAYAERLTWEMGLYDDDPYGNIGRLVCELIRAARLVADTGIHAKRWTRDEARAYLDEAIGAAPGSFHLEVDRIVVTPAQAIGSEIGMLAILDLRERAKADLGAGFDLKAFHNAVIGQGNLPLAVLERVVNDHIAAERRPSP